MKNRFLKRRLIILFLILCLISTPITFGMNLIDIKTYRESYWDIGTYGTYSLEPPGSGYNYLYSNCSVGEFSSYITNAFDFSDYDFINFNFVLSCPSTGISIVNIYSGGIGVDYWEENIFFTHENNPPGSYIQNLLVILDDYIFKDEVYFEFYHFCSYGNNTPPGFAIDDINIPEIGFFEGFEIFNGSLLGYVTDNFGHPIKDALIRVHFHGTYEENYSNENGFYHVTNIPICYCLKNCTCSKEGYTTEWILMGIVENTTYDFVLTDLLQDSYIDCSGDVWWEDIKPGDTVTATITVENIGEPESLLNWTVRSYPDWGTWTFNPESGTDLLAGESVEIDIEIIAPEDPLTEFEGEIKIENTQNIDDYCIIEPSLITIKNSQYHNNIFYFIFQFQLKEILKNMFPILYQLSNNYF